MVLLWVLKVALETDFGETCPLFQNHFFSLWVLIRSLTLLLMVLNGFDASTSGIFGCRCSGFDASAKFRRC